MPDLKLAVVGATGAVGPEVLRCWRSGSSPRPRWWPSPRPARRASGWRLPAPSSRCGNSPPMPSRDSIWRCSRPGRAPPARSRPKRSRADVWWSTSPAAFRMDPQVPLVVPEVNAEATDSHNGIVANPNCSTIQFVAVLKPLLDAVGLEHVTVATYQAVSGTGTKAMDELDRPDARGDRGRAGRDDRLPASDRLQRAATLRRLRR